MKCQTLSILAATLLLVPLGAQDVRLKTIPVADGIYMLEGNGGNIGLCVGADGPFLIDDQFAPMVPQIKAAVAKLSKQPIKFLVNTHHHGDHTGGNERLGSAGVLIYSHDNARKRIQADQLRKNIQERAGAALPVVTFDKSLTFYWNKATIRVVHLGAAHTDGDAIIHFKEANVVHMGDTFFNGRFPFIDVKSGGSAAGLIGVIDKVLAMTDAKTKIIPGHGPLAKRADLEVYRKMLVTVHGRVRDLVAAGKSEEEILAAQPSKEFDEKWTWGFINPERFVGALVMSVRLANSKKLRKRRK